MMKLFGDSDGRWNGSKLIWIQDILTEPDFEGLGWCDTRLMIKNLMINDEMRMMMKKISPDEILMMTGIDAEWLCGYGWNKANLMNKWFWDLEIEEEYGYENRRYGTVGMILGDVGFEHRCYVGLSMLPQHL
jgi:hypothetical protein